MSKEKITVRVGSKFKPTKEWTGYVGGVEVDLYGIIIDDLVETLLNYKKDYPEYEELYIEKRQEYEDTINVLRGTRLETDEEYKWRIAREERDKKWRLAKEREDYERLKAKFENK